MTKKFINKNQIIGVSGYSGFIGKNLIYQLKLRDFKKIYLISRNSKLSFKNFENVELINVGNKYEKLEKFRKKIKKIDIFYHLAYQNNLITATKNPKKDLNTNLNLIKKILNNLKLQSTFIFTSSVSIYGSSEKKINEKKNLDPLSNYDLNKISCENYIKKFCNEYKINYVIFRLSNIYGVQKKNINNRGFLYTFIKKIYLSKSIKLNTYGKYFRDYLYIDDCVNGLIKGISLKKKNLNMTFNLVNGKSYTLNSIFILTKKIIIKQYNIKSLSKLTYNVCDKILPTDLRNFFGSYNLYKTSNKWKPQVNLKSGIIKILNDFKN